VGLVLGLGLGLDAPEPTLVRSMGVLLSLLAPPPPPAWMLVAFVGDGGGAVPLAVSFATGSGDAAGSMRKLPTPCRVVRPAWSVRRTSTPYDPASVGARRPLHVEPDPARSTRDPSERSARADATPDASSCALTARTTPSPPTVALGAPKLAEPSVGGAASTRTSCACSASLGAPASSACQWSVCAPTGSAKDAEYVWSAPSST